MDVAETKVDNLELPSLGGGLQEKIFGLDVPVCYIVSMEIIYTVHLGLTRRFSCWSELFKRTTI